MGKEQEHIVLVPQLGIAAHIDGTHAHVVVEDPHIAQVLGEGAQTYLDQEQSGSDKQITVY